MATGKLVGHDDVIPSAYGDPNYISTTKYQALATGTVTQFCLRCNGSGNVKVAIYADNAGEPGARLGVVNTGTAVVAGWNTITFPETPVTKGSYYWLAIVADAGNIAGYKPEAQLAKRYKSFPFTTGLPDPAGTGYTVETTTQDVFAGWGVLVLSPSSINQPVGYGSPQLNLSIQPSSIVQSIVYGTPIIDTGQIIIQPSSIVQVVAIGIPALRYPQAISPSSIIVTIAYGTPSVGILGIIMPQSIVQPVAIGTPTILKYVWHVILDGQYLSESPNINRAYIIGRDANGNPVWGEAHDSAESGLVGERLDFTQELAIPTTAQAGDVASAILAKMRLMGKRGVILIPPNCGQELFDVVQISDAGANQSAVTFRVVGLRFEYNPKQARYQHKLILGAP